MTSDPQISTPAAPASDLWPRASDLRPPAPGLRPPLRVALVHDWLTGMRGGEKVLDAICELYPEAPLYTLVQVPGTASARIESRPVRRSIAQRLPGAGKYYRQYLPLLPAAVEFFDFDDYDLVISTSHCAVKSVIRPGRAVHVSYCHSPMRYAWDQFEEYFGVRRLGAARSRLLRSVMAALARWDASTAGRVDRFVANSRYVAGRIRRYYNRGSTVVYPPVDTTYYRPASDTVADPSSDSGFLVVSALVPYKRLEVAIDACRRLGAPLRIVGTGPDLGRLQGIAGPDVEFLGWRSDEEIRELYRRSTAVLLPGVEDFGMVPVEAQACGCPVVALNAGGASETVVDGETGVLVEDSTADAFADGLDRVRRQTFAFERLRAHALQFSRARFLAQFQAVVHEAVAAREDEKTAASNLSMRQPAAREDVDPAASNSHLRQPAAREDEQ